MFKDITWFSFLRHAFRTPTVRALALSVFLTLGYYTFLYYIFEYHYNSDFFMPDFVIYTMGYIIALLFYFRLNSSFYRWNDGAKSLAYLKANAETFLMKSRIYLGEDSEDVHFFHIMIGNHYKALRDMLRDIRKTRDLVEPEPGYNEKMAKAYVLSNRINELIQERINQLYKSGKLTRVQFWDINKIVTKNTELVAACQAIHNTPPPKSYIVHIRSFLVAYMFMIPFGFMGHYEVWMIFFLSVYFYFYTGLEIISEEIQDPFGFDVNDLPLVGITQDTLTRLEEIKNLKYES